jgi:uncharacterized protein YjiS (DUF1127 family)
MKQITLAQYELAQTDAFRTGMIESAVENATAALRLWRRRSNQRRHLARLSLRELDDIGITDAERLEETVKPFWRA